MIATKNHSISDNHSPTDEGDYAMGVMIREAKAVLSVDPSEVTP